MGGNLFKGRNRRVTRYEMDLITTRLCEAVDMAKGVIVPIQAYHSKESFGDIDVLYSIPKDLDLMQLIDTLPKTGLNVRDVHRNGDVTSLLVQLTDNEEELGVQVDLIKATKQWYVNGDFNINCFYFNFNDLGNFIGRVAHKLGFKFGHDGLWYELRDPECESRLFRSIPITGNPNSIMYFLGYESSWYLAASEGFDRDFPSTFHNMEGVYEFAASSKYFDPASIMLNNRSYKGRVRDAKRESYNGFIEWLKVRYPDIKDDTPPTLVDRQEHLERAFKIFPMFQADYKQALIDLEHYKAFRKVFNGENVSQWTSLEGKELGAVMKNVREYIERNELKLWVRSLTPEEFEPVFKMIMNKLDRRVK